MSLPDNIRSAIKCGPVPDLRPIEDIVADPQTVGEGIVAFAANHLRVGDGPKIGERLLLEPFQIAFILAVFDNPHTTRFAYLSVAARNGKTMLMAVILCAFLIGPLRKKNVEIASGAMSRDQAALCYKSMTNILSMSPDCEGLYSATPSSKKIVGLSCNAAYQALSSDAKTGYGMSLKTILLDEASQVKGPSSAFTDMLESRSGSYDDALMLQISTQSASDMDYFSVALDGAEASDDPNTVCHVYKADEDCDLLDETQWYKANPGLGIFRSLKELKKQMEVASGQPTKESQYRNQFLNQRISADHIAFPPNIWKPCGGEIDLQVFRENKVYAGLDLSARNDLTACVLCSEDSDGQIHVLPFVFCPTSGVEDRSRRDRAPYATWIEQGFMYPVGGKTMDYDQIAETMKHELDDMDIVVDEIHFDKWNMENFKAACQRRSAFESAEFIEVPQYFTDMGHRLTSLSTLVIEGKIRHGSHPVLNMAASVAVAKSGREGLSALAKDLSTQRIDPMVALVMAAYPLGDGRENFEEVDVSSWVA